MINLNKRRSSSVMSSGEENYEYALDIKDDENQGTVPSFDSSK